MHTKGVSRLTTASSACGRQQGAADGAMSTCHPRPCCTPKSIWQGSASFSKTLRLGRIGLSDSSSTVNLSLRKPVALAHRHNNTVARPPSRK
eukprot:scaffold83543_cov36-Tisochrysis_lutea.AAC.1